MRATETSISFPSIPNIIPLVDYLGNAREYLDVVCDQTDAGMSIVAGSQEYSIRANWKLLTENSIDGYHATTTHASYFDILMNTTDNLSTGRMGGYGHDLGNGHAVLEYGAPWGRPVAQWIPGWGEAGKTEIARQYDKLVQLLRQGPGRPNRADESQSVHFSEPRRQRHHGLDGSNLFSDGARLHDDQRLGPGAER